MHSKYGGRFNRGLRGVYLGKELQTLRVLKTTKRELEERIPCVFFSLN